MDSDPPTVYASVDWFSLTTGERAEADEAWERACALGAELVVAGDRRRDWGANGYQGFGLPHLRWGHRAGDVLVEISGDLADRYWRQFYPLAHNVTRIDTAVTCTFLTETTGLARQGLLADPVRPRPGLRAITKTYWEKVGGGETLYLGSPKSARFARLYDKTAESEGRYPPNTWRYELQERRHMGRARADLLIDAADADPVIRAGVHGFYSYHGVNPWFLSAGPRVFAAARPAATSRERTEQWVERAVASSYRRACAEGWGDVFLRRLGAPSRRSS